MTRPWHHRVLNALGFYEWWEVRHIGSSGYTVALFPSLGDAGIYGRFWQERIEREHPHDGFWRIEHKLFLRVRP